MRTTTVKAKAGRESGRVQLLPSGFYSLNPPHLGLLTPKTNSRMPPYYNPL